MKQSVESLRERLILYASHAGVVDPKETDEMMKAFALFLEGIEWPEKKEEHFDLPDGKLSVHSSNVGYNRGVSDSIAAFNALMEGLWAAPTPEQQEGKETI